MYILIVMEVLVHFGKLLVWWSTEWYTESECGCEAVADSNVPIPNTPFFIPHTATLDPRSGHYLEMPTPTRSS